MAVFQNVDKNIDDLFRGILILASLIDPLPRLGAATILSMTNMYLVRRRLDSRPQSIMGNELLIACAALM